jgi:ketosteroid isomerase-like protein
MEKRVFVCLALVAALAATGTWASHHEGGMEALAKGWEEAYNAGDVAAIVAGYAEDSMRMPPDMPTVTGPEAIQEQIQGGIDAGMVSIKITVVDSKMMDGVGFGNGTFELMDAEGNTIAIGKWANAVKMVDGEWKIQYDIFNYDAPMVVAE